MLSLCWDVMRCQAVWQKIPNIDSMLDISNDKIWYQMLLWEGITALSWWIPANNCLKNGNFALATTYYVIQCMWRVMQFQIGRMHLCCGRLMKIRGTNIMLTVEPSATTDNILPAAVNKLSMLDREMSTDVSYVLLFPDGTKVDRAPGSTEQFTLLAYKQFTGRPYQKLALFVCTENDYKEGWICYQFAVWFLHSHVIIDPGVVEFRRRTASSFYGVEVVEWPVTPPSNFFRAVAVGFYLPFFDAINQ